MPDPQHIPPVPPMRLQNPELYYGVALASVLLCRALWDGTESTTYILNMIVTFAWTPLVVEITLHRARIEVPS